MKVLMVSEDIPQKNLGGLGKHAITLANALIEAGHEVDLFGNNYSPYENHPGDVHFLGRFEPALNMKHAQWKEKQLGFFNYHRRAFLARRFARAILAVAGRYDVIHYHGHLPILANYISENVNFVQTRHDQGSDCLTHTRFRHGDVCRETDARVCAGCATAHPNVMQRALSAASVHRWRREARRAFERHKVIFVSQFLRDNLMRTLGPLDDARAHVVHNFLNMATLKKVLEGNDDEERMPDIFIAGRIDAAKGIEAFLAAAERRLPRDRRVTVAGHGPDLAALRARFRTDWVEFLDWLPYRETIRATARARIVVVPSVLEEAFGLTTLEALALGRTCYALNRGGTPELNIYEQYPGQLRLFETMDSLVTGLIEDDNRSVGTMAGAGFAADISAILPRIIAVYQSHPENTSA